MNGSNAPETRLCAARSGWSETLRPTGRYNRSRFFLGFCLPLVGITVIIPNLWRFESVVIKISFYIGLLKYDVHKMTTAISIVLVLLLVYLLAIAACKRCNDLNISRWLTLLFLVPLLDIAFLAYLLIWPGTRQSGSHKKLSAKVGLSVSVFLLFAVFTAFGTVFLVLVAATQDGESSPLWLWNQTDRPVNVQIATLQYPIIQGYPIHRVSPQALVRNDAVLWRDADYAVKVSDDTGKLLFNKTYLAGDIANSGWTIVITDTP